MASLRCYHHSNCEDHPAVATCSKCGKGLCRECADNLRSEETGKPLCVDCLNAELEEESMWGLRIRQDLKKELIRMIVGLVVGLVIGSFFYLLLSNDINYGQFFPTQESKSLFALYSFLFFPTLCASFGTIWGLTRNVSWLFKIPVFLILIVVSPVMFIVRIIRHAKRMKLAKDYAIWQIRKQVANEEYAECAREMVTISSKAEFEREMATKYANLAKEEADKLIAQERAEREALEKRNAELAKELEAKGKEISESDKQLKELQVKENKLNLANKRSKASRRSTDDVDSGKKAA